MNMKKCPRCGNENSDGMIYCLECGESLGESPVAGWPLTGAKTESYSEQQTVVRNPPQATQNFRGELPATRSASINKKIFVVIGGIVALGLLVIVGAAAIIGYNYFARTKTVVSNGNNSTQNTGNKTGTPSNSSSPAVTPSPVVSFTPPVEPTKNGTFSVFANAGWQLSNIDTVALENFRTKVQGKVDLVGVKTGISASGVNDAASKSRRIYPEFPTGALLMRTRYADGKYSNVMAVTTSGANGSWQNFPDERGRIEFCINDNAPEQNGGQFTVTVTFTSIAKQKK